MIDHSQIGLLNFSHPESKTWIGMISAEPIKYCLTDPRKFEGTELFKQYTAAMRESSRLEKRDAETEKLEENQRKKYETAQKLISINEYLL